MDVTAVPTPTPDCDIGACSGGTAIASTNRTTTYDKWTTKIRILTRPMKGKSYADALKSDRNAVREKDSSDNAPHKRETNVLAGAKESWCGDVAWCSDPGNQSIHSVESSIYSDLIPNQQCSSKVFNGKMPGPFRGEGKVEGARHKHGKAQEITHETSHKMFGEIIKGKFKEPLQRAIEQEQVKVLLPFQGTSNGVEWDCREERHEFRPNELGEEIEAGYHSQQRGAGRESAVRARDGNDALYANPEEDSVKSGGDLPTESCIESALVLQEVSGSMMSTPSKSVRRVVDAFVVHIVTYSETLQLNLRAWTE